MSSSKTSEPVCCLVVYQATKKMGCAMCTPEHEVSGAPRLVEINIENIRGLCDQKCKKMTGAVTAQKSINSSLYQKLFKSKFFPTFDEKISSVKPKNLLVASAIQERHMNVPFQDTIVMTQGQKPRSNASEQTRDEYKMYMTEMAKMLNSIKLPDTPGKLYNVHPVGFHDAVTAMTVKKLLEGVLQGKKGQKRKIEVPGFKPEEAEAIAAYMDQQDDEMNAAALAAASDDEEEVDEVVVEIGANESSDPGAV